MAKSNAVWGIEVGQCSLKAIRCTLDNDGETLVADAFDFIEYPKILSQPDANPDELIKEALEQFLSRNELRGDGVAISVSGQAGLSRFFKPPPVDAKTLPDIVKYEARQQIPFALEDVIWDYQQIGGKVIDGLTVDAEVGLFAMKREAVFKALQPFLDSEVEVDIVQLSPVTIHNVVVHDLMTNLPDPDDVDPNNPPESMVVISMGTDTTDLVISDGSKLWLRNIPIGGNHFTKQLSRELKLTYAKAEHLKRNARRAEDPKTIFQAMRPVFSDLVTELQRSISYFQGLERNAKIGHVVMFGNASNLPGLRQYLTKHLGIEITKFNEYKHLSGDSVLSSKQYQENMLSFATCYGLCLQGLKKSRLQTNLLPQEFITERMVRAKKPWALAAVSALLLGFSFNFFFTFQAWWEVHKENETNGVSWSQALGDADTVSRLLSGFQTTDEQQMTKLQEVHEMEAAVSGVTDGRRVWSEMLSALYQAFPHDPRINPDEPVDPMVVPYMNRQEIYIEYLETELYTDLSQWYSTEIATRYADDKGYVQPQLEPPAGEGDVAANADGAGGPVDPSAAPDGGFGGAGGAAGGTGGAEPGPSGPGVVIEMRGYHYFNGPNAVRDGLGGITYVRNTVIKNILDRKFKVRIPMPPGSPQKFTQFTMREMGFSHPVIVEDNEIQLNFQIENVNFASATRSEDDSEDESDTDTSDDSSTDESTTPSAGEPRFFPAPKYEFVIQIAWKPTPLNERIENREERRRRREAEAAAGGGVPGADPGVPGNPTPAGPTGTDPNAVDPNAVDPNAGNANPANPTGDNGAGVDNNPTGDNGTAPGGNPIPPPDPNGGGAAPGNGGAGGGNGTDNAGGGDPNGNNGQ